MQTYPLGFLFSQDCSQVLLIHKNRPVWQVGKMNGIGGKIEAQETPKQGIVREFAEETGLKTTEHDWQHAGLLQSSFFETHILFAVYKKSFGKEVAKTDEQIEWVATQNLPINCMSNLSWLIPACLDQLKNTKEPFSLLATYTI